MKTVKLRFLAATLALSMLWAVGCGQEGTSPPETGGTTETASDGTESQTAESDGSVTESPTGNINTSSQTNEAAGTSGVTGSTTPSKAQQSPSGTVTAPSADEFKLSAASEIKEIDFSDVTPDNYTLKASWDCMGMDGGGVVYIGWTCLRKDNGLEDCAVFSYDPASGTRRFIDTLMEASERAGNLNQGEAVPKGHTKILFVNGKMFLASQNFHDFKEDIDELSTMRGAHLYRYDPTQPGQKLTDLSAGLSGGVAVKNQGIIALSAMPSQGLIVGLTHPLSDLVFFDPVTNRVVRNVKGIPWTLGNPVSREIVVSGDKVYLYRGTEEPQFRNNRYSVYVYDYKTDGLTKTSNTCFGGFWNGQATTKDGKKTYISTSCGELYVLDTASGQMKHLTHMLPGDIYSSGSKISYAYSISLSSDEKKLYFIPTFLSESLSALYEYDVSYEKVSTVKKMPSRIYTGNNISGNNYFYFGQFGVNSGNWNGNARLLAIRIGTA